MNSYGSPAPSAGVFNLNTMAKNVAAPVANFASNISKNVTVPMTNFATNVAKNVTAPMTNLAKTVNSVINGNSGSSGNSGNSGNSGMSGNNGSMFSNGLTEMSPSTSQIFFIGLLLILLSIIAIYWQQIHTGFRVLYEKVRQLFGAAPSSVPPDAIEKRDQEEKITDKPHGPQEPNRDKHSLVEKVLPGRKEVFNVSKNIFTFADAEPLCRALGAELATYEQVKQAYGQGADWCNYGWVKGQMAVYPTQEDTWKKLQEGPEEERNACGRPGINGGFFDNPDLRYGVNCFGPKPDQSNHDANTMTSGAGAPLSPEGLEIDKKVQKYRGEADSIGILPWNRESWSG